MHHHLLACRSPLKLLGVCCCSSIDYLGGVFSLNLPDTSPWICTHMSDNSKSDPSSALETIIYIVWYVCLMQKRKKKKRTSANYVVMDVLRLAP